MYITMGRGLAVVQSVPREQGQYAREFYTTVKTSYIQA